ncbi:hypothetical protein D3C75_1060610 [compost metagenome]
MELAGQPVDQQHHVRGQAHRRPAGRRLAEPVPDRPRRSALAVEEPRRAERALLDELWRALHQRVHRAEEPRPALRAAGQDR